MSTWYKRSKLVWDTLRKPRFIKFEDTLRKQEFISNCKSFATGAALGAVFCATTHPETIPYSSRTHIVPKSLLLEKNLFGNFTYWMEKKLGNWQEVPSTHPASLRLKPIAERVFQSANMVSDHFEWEVIVVDKPDGFSAHSLPNGMIIFDRGLVESFESDDEIAALMSNMVAKQLARHCVEYSGKGGFLGVLFKVLLPWKISYNVTVLAAMALPMFALSRKLKTEEKYIGMMVTARAGYDPGAAITLARKDPRLNSSFDLFSGFPSQRKTLEILGEAQDEAMVLYKKGKPFQP